MEVLLRIYVGMAQWFQIKVLWERPVSTLSALLKICLDISMVYDTMTLQANVYPQV